MAARKDGADEFLALHGVVIDVDSIVGGSATRRCDVGDESREAHRACVDAKLQCIVVAEQLAAHLCNAVHGAWLLDGVLRSAVLRSVGAERADGTRREDGAAIFARDFQGVHQAADGDFPRQLRLALGHSAKQGGKIVDGVDVVFFHCIGNLLSIGDVDNHRRSALGEFALRLCSGDVTGHDVAAFVNASQFHSQLTAYLASRANN